MELNHNNFIKNKEFFISKNDWNILIAKYTKEDIKHEIIKCIRNNNLPLPFDCPSCEEMVQSFEELCMLNTDNFLKCGEWFSRYDYKYHKNNYYLDCNNVGLKASNYFHFHERMKCDSINSPSPIRVWENDKFLSTLLNYFWSGLVSTDITKNTFKTAINMRKYVASQFKPSVAKYIYDNYSNNGCVLDFSSGWGDRLLGFHASNAEKYIGIDPNVNLTQNYYNQNMSYNTNKVVDIICKPAEDVNILDEVDLIFTSCPYFDVERYTKDDTQSYKKYKTLDKWLEGFLFKSIDNFWKNLKPNGYLILNISDIYTHHKIQKICDPMNDHIEKLSGAQYQGAIGMRMAKRPNSKASKDGIFCEPMWIWKKT
jgi:hypothetical protein